MGICIDYAVSIMAAAAELQAMTEDQLSEHKDWLNDVDDEIHGILDYIENGPDDEPVYTLADQYGHSPYFNPDNTWEGMDSRYPTPEL